MKNRLQFGIIALAVCVIGSLTALYAAPQKDNTKEKDKTTKTDTKKLPFERVVKTEAEWKKILPPNTFEITRKAGTEPAFNNEYWNNHEAGVYKCADCGLELFTSKTKFESHTGWPSFWKPIADNHIKTRTDADNERTEVLCARCDAHLGHVFDDGPKPTGLRYCMNSASLKFVKETKPAKGK